MYVCTLVSHSTINNLIQALIRVSSAILCCVFYIPLFWNHDLGSLFCILTQPFEGYLVPTKFSTDFLVWNISWSPKIVRVARKVTTADYTVDI